MCLRLAAFVLVALATFVIGAALGADLPEPGSAELLWGDINCSEEQDQEEAVNAGDALAVLQNSAGGYVWAGGSVCLDYLYHFDLVVEADGVVVAWGDVNCDGDVGPLDALAILRHRAGVSPSPQVEPCPDVGDRVEIRRT